LLAAARSGRPVILSTGMSTLSDVETALGILAFGYTHDGPPASMAATQEAFASSEGRSALEDKVVLLHCTSEYPAPFSEVNLRAMETLAAAFGLPVGYSDHTPGIAIPIAAAARGAVVVEKHFTIDRSLPGPDHPASLEPAELTAMVRAIRQVEEALGSPTKGPTPAELRNRDVARKSLVTSRAIRRGELFTPENLTIKRPGTGLSATLYWDWLGRAATRDYPPDALVEP
jgi:N-acetylneuraminate synthase